MKNQSYLIGDAVKILGVSRERFYEWKLRKFIKASDSETQGNRTISRYTYFDLLSIKLFERLLKDSSRNYANLCRIAMYSREQDILSSDARYIAFFKWPMGKPYFPEWPRKTIEGRNVFQPVLRVINETDTAKSYNTLFVEFDDVDPPLEKDNLVKIPFERLMIVDLREIKRLVNEGINSL